MGGKGSGRKKKTVELANCGQILAGAAIPAARYLRDVVNGTITKPSWARIEVSKYIIDHELGKARIKAEITGAGGTPLTWQALVILAEEAEREGEPPKIVGGKLITMGEEKPPKGE